MPEQLPVRYPKKYCFIRIIPHQNPKLLLQTVLFIFVQQNWTVFIVMIQNIFHFDTWLWITIWSWKSSFCIFYINDSLSVLKTNEINKVFLIWAIRKCTTSIDWTNLIQTYLGLSIFLINLEIIMYMWWCI